MAFRLFLALVMQSLFQQPRMVGEELDEATRERMRQRAEYLSQQMARLLQELEQSSQEQSGFARGRLLFAALWDWRFWLMAGVLGLLFGLSWWCGQRWWEPKRSSRLEESSIRHTEQEDEEEQEESEGEAPPDEQDLARIYARRIQWPVKELAFRRQLVMELVSSLLGILQGPLSNYLSPVLQPAIGVGSAFEGWSSWDDDEDIVYQLLVPLKPPLGHAFHLELGAVGQMPAKDSRVRVELVCTCTTGSLGEDTLCFLHNPEKKLRSKEAASFLGTLCTGSYLDAQKTAHWFQSKAKSAWLLLPQPQCFDMKVLPSSRSCKLQLTNASKGTLIAELVFGVQQGDSDIFLSSQTPEAAFTPSTTWPQSYAVAEAKFFRYVTRQAPHGKFPLRCLHLCTRILLGTGLSTSAMKTIVMHLLSTTPLSGWCGKDFLLRLDDIMCYLRRSLETKRLTHFFFGNKNMPEEIVLPPALQTSEPVNLFQHLAQDPAAHDEALRQLVELQDQLERLLFYGIQKRPSCPEQCLQRSPLMTRDCL